jgi:DNA-binding GntR family transcriptional regulator
MNVNNVADRIVEGFHMSDTTTKATETDTTYMRLHQAIVQGSLLPNERLIELDLAQRYSVGRAAIRTALARLEQEALVEREPNRGARVRAISANEAVEMLEARAALEGLAAGFAARRATDTDIAALRGLCTAMQQQLDAGELVDFSDLNSQFHSLLLRIADHTTIARLLERLHAQHVMFQYRMVLMAGRAAHSLAEHHIIVDAIAAHDADAAEAAMRTHLLHAADTLRQTLGSLERRQLALR